MNEAVDVPVARDYIPARCRPMHVWPDVALPDQSVRNSATRMGRRVKQVEGALAHGEWHVRTDRVFVDVAVNGCVLRTPGQLFEL